MPRAKRRRTHGGARPNSGPEPNPEACRELVAMRLPRELVASLRELAKRSGKSQTSIVASALARHMLDARMSGE